MPSDQPMVLAPGLLVGRFAPPADCVNAMRGFNPAPPVQFALPPHAIYVQHALTRIRESTQHAEGPRGLGSILAALEGSRAIGIERILV
jgi:hypothetical protein